MVAANIKAAIGAEIERLSKLAIKAIGARAETEAVDLIKKAELQFTGILKTRASEDYARFEKIKTLFSEGKLVDLDSIYVDQRLKWGKEKISESEFRQRLTSERRVVLTGMAGTGKSLLLRQLFRHLAAGKSTAYPIFVELRSLKAAKYPTILSHISTALSNRKYKLDDEHIRIALEGGALALLLDGFDEIDFDARERYDDEINNLAKTYSNTTIAVTGRPDQQRFETWTHFHEVTVLPMDPGQTIELINKIDEDETVKKNFIAQAQKTLFKTHATFLGTPLLASMMLITYSRIADIPTKHHIFYREAFAALFDRHDASKGGP